MYDFDIDFCLFEKKRKKKEKKIQYAVEEKTTAKSLKRRTLTMFL
jgi:hypothetical protein